MGCNLTDFNARHGERGGRSQEVMIVRFLATDGVNETADFILFLLFEPLDLHILTLGNNYSCDSSSKLSTFILGMCYIMNTYSYSGNLQVFIPGQVQTLSSRRNKLK